VGERISKAEGEQIPNDKKQIPKGWAQL